MREMAGIFFDEQGVGKPGGLRREWQTLTGIEVAPPLWRSVRGWEVTFFFADGDPLRVRSEQDFFGRERMTGLRALLGAARTGAPAGAVMSARVGLILGGGDPTSGELLAAWREVDEARARRDATAAWRGWEKLPAHEVEAKTRLVAIVEEMGACPGFVVSEIEGELLRAPRDPAVVERTTRIYLAVDHELAEIYARLHQGPKRSAAIARGYARWCLRRGRTTEAETMLREMRDAAVNPEERQGFAADLLGVQVFQHDRGERSRVFRRQRAWIAGAATAGLVAVGIGGGYFAFTRLERQRVSDEAKADAADRRQRAESHRLLASGAERKRFAELQKLAPNGDADVMYELSRNYRTGRATPLDAVEERKWLEKAAEAGLVRAQVTLAGMLRAGRGAVEKDEAKALEWSRRAAEKGEMDAREQVMLAYRSGSGVEKDEAKALQLSKELAVEGNNWAKVQVALATINGWGVPKDVDAGIAQLKREAEKDNPYAWGNLGNFHEVGTGVAKDYAEAIKCYERAGRLGDLAADAARARLLYRGLGAPKDASLAEELARKAALEDRREAQGTLAIILSDRQRKPPAPAEARYWAERAVNEKYRTAGQILAESLLRPADRSPADEKLARTLLLEQAEAGNTAAMNRLASLMTAGIGGPKDGAAALSWWNKAVSAGNVDAMVALAEVYQLGDTAARIYPDRAEARRLLTTAAAKGSAEAKRQLAVLSELRIPTDADTKVWQAPPGLLDNLPENGAPVVVRRQRPIYPAALRRNGTTGDVLVDFIVDTEGRPQNVTVVRASQAEFIGPAIAAVQQWAFKPGTKNGRRVRAHMQVPVVFTLNEDPPTSALEKILKK